MVSIKNVKNTFLMFQWLLPLRKQQSPHAAVLSCWLWNWILIPRLFLCEPILTLTLGLVADSLHAPSTLLFPSFVNTIPSTSLSQAHPLVCCLRTVLCRVRKGIDLFFVLFPCAGYVPSTQCKRLARIHATRSNVRHLDEASWCGVFLWWYWAFGS